MPLDRSAIEQREGQLRKQPGNRCEFERPKDQQVGEGDVRMGMDRKTRSWLSKLQSVMKTVITTIIPICDLTEMI